MNLNLKNFNLKAHSGPKLPFKKMKIKIKKN